MISLVYSTKGLITDLIKTNNNLRDDLKTAKDKRRPSSTTPLASFESKRSDDGKNCDDSRDQEVTTGSNVLISNNAQPILGVNNNNNNSNNKNNISVASSGNSNNAPNKRGSSLSTPTSFFIPHPNSVKERANAGEEESADAGAEKTERELKVHVTCVCVWICVDTFVCFNNRFCVVTFHL